MKCNFILKTIIKVETFYTIRKFLLNLMNFIKVCKVWNSFVKVNDYVMRKIWKYLKIFWEIYWQFEINFNKNLKMCAKTCLQFSLLTEACAFSQPLQFFWFGALPLFLHGNAPADAYIAIVSIDYI